mgnify:CR=1 FL=1
MHGLAKAHVVRKAGAKAQGTHIVQPGKPGPLVGAQHPAFLTVTTYGMAARITGLQNIVWECVILDEAQAIKNPGPVAQ